MNLFPRLRPRRACHDGGCAKRRLCMKCEPWVPQEAWQIIWKTSRDNLGFQRMVQLWRAAIGGKLSPLSTGLSKSPRRPSASTSSLMRVVNWRLGLPGLDPLAELIALRLRLHGGHLEFLRRPVTCELSVPGSRALALLIHRQNHHGCGRNAGRSAHGADETSC
jgi:hypothetical protein